MNYPMAGMGDHNYCRNPPVPNLNAVQPWCLTVDPQNPSIWDYCDVGEAQTDCLGRFAMSI